MNLLTFLGTGNYKPTTYTLDGKTHTTPYAPAATAHFYRPEKTLIVVTDAAEAKHFETLADEIAAVTQPVAIPIPDGHSEAELWHIFNALTEHVAEGDELVVDITNGFRSLPFLSFLAVVFLRIARRVKVRRILYGAWDARDDNNHSPIFDLTPFLALLDWTIATDRFTRFGDAADLAELLRGGIPPGPQMRDDMQARQLGNALKYAARAMDEVSLATRLTRPIESMTGAARLVDNLQKVSPLIAGNAPPFSLLAEQMVQAYEPVAFAADPLDPLNWSANLDIQLNLIGRYLEQGQIVQAVTLAREWLVSLLANHFGVELLTDKAAREPVEYALNNAAAIQRGSAPGFETCFHELLQSMPQASELAKLWDELTHLRNDIAHVGMNLDPSPAVNLHKRSERIYPRLRALAKTLVIINPTSEQPHDPH